VGLKQERKMKKKNMRFGIADIVTLLNLVSGFLAIYSSAKGYFIQACYFILFGVLFDFLDGRVARYLNQESEIGKHLDSLADIVSFGIAPAVMLSIYISSPLIIIISTIFVSCGTYRLARFNVQKVKGFRGMPITVNGVLFPMLFLIGLRNEYVYAVLLLISACLMVSKIKINKI
jgi:CDP-diacylglycerol--serine O-phosphatidyltransferase